MRTVVEIIEQAFECHRAGDLDGAASIYDQLLGQVEDDPNVLYAYGTLLMSRGSYGLGLQLMRRCVKLLPKHAAAWCNIGIALHHSSRDDQAIAAYRRAIAQEPENAVFLANFAGCLVASGRPEEVIDFASRALEFDPVNHHAHTHLGLGLLEAARPNGAWGHYEHRFLLPDAVSKLRPYAAPRWHGEHVDLLAIHGEQGIGDEILFASAIASARKNCRRLAIECAPRLKAIFGDSFDAAIYGEHAELIAAEAEPTAWVPMGSLMDITGLPNGKPYLFRNDRQDRGRKRIGIAWRAGVRRTALYDRSISLEEMKPLLDWCAGQGHEVTSVQYERDDIRDEAERFGLELLPREDLDAIQDRIANCDAIVSTCQTALHQAGSMGVRAIGLTPHRCAWRWSKAWSESGETVPWYRSVKLIRQDVTETWAPVVQAAIAALPGVL